MSHSSMIPSPKSSSFMHPSSRNPRSFQKVQMNDLPFLKSSASCTEPASDTGRHSYTRSHSMEIESSFLRSLSSIHLDSPSRRMPKSRCCSVNDLCDSRSDTHSSHSKGQAFESSHCQRRKAAMDPKEKNGFLVQGILRTSKKDYILQEQPTYQTSPRVSFAHHKDGILKRSVSYYFVDSLSTDSCNTSSTRSDGCNTSFINYSSVAEGSALNSKIRNLESMIQSIQKN